MGLKVEGGETKVENKIIRIGLRVIAGAIIGFYAAYIIIKKWEDGEVSLDLVDQGVIAGAIAMLIAVESVRYYVKKKLEKE